MVARLGSSGRRWSSYRPAGARVGDPIRGPGRTFHGGSWTWTSASAGEGRSKGQGGSHAGKVCLPELQGVGVGEAFTETGMRGLPGAHGLRATHRRNAGVGPGLGINLGIKITYSC